jgi:hypothetical protein
MLTTPTLVLEGSTTSAWKRDYGGKEHDDGQFFKGFVV